MSRSFWQLVSIEFLSFFREPGALFWSFLFPVAMAWGLGIAFSSRMETHKNVGLILTHPSYADSLRAFGTDTAIPDSTLVLSIGNKSSDHSFPVLSDKLGGGIHIIKAGYHLSLKRRIINRFSFDPQNSEGKLAYLQIEPLLNKEKMCMTGKRSRSYSKRGFGILTS
jgi:hypothetical protein